MSSPVPDFADAPWHDGSDQALIQGAHIWSYTELREHVIERAARLRAQSVRPGQVVMAPDTPALDLILMLHALAKIGAALLPYRAGLPAAELHIVSAMTGADWQWPPAPGRRTPTGFGADKPDYSDPSIALLIKTSGSSGVPKVAMLTSANLLVSAASANAQFGLTSGDIWLACLRLSHVGGVSIAHRCALAGATLLLHDGFDAQAVSHDLRRWPVTHLSLVPPMLARLLDLDPTPPPRLRVLLVGGQALSRPLAQRALDAGWPLYLTYGMTETASHLATTARLTGAAPEPGLVGRPLPGIQIDRRGSESAPVRLRFCGPVVMAGYANPQRMPGQGLNDGWFEAADLGYLTDEGELKLLGRADDILVIGGNNVSRVRVEGILQQVPGVKDLVVVGLPDPLWGHRLVAVYRGGINEASLEDWCRTRLAGPERPRVLLRLPQLPLLDSGKYDRLRIAALAAALGDVRKKEAPSVGAI